ncbi:hypothetical protein [Tessaracoccus sp. OH4464_COT-324]|uniref:hypothetical protein n=1 Tax=Tessaracoccus sp. OH4464_COT-324 TaxID=2491059 RepID=UPI000F630B3A|nr:hypothetical protein [Tessaracoccus sp. OH4464_COT-324]RRD45601.1 hypothetical protein EII42_10905 [Tessaracoccus sp. OH4464_COT-324]
MSIKPRIVLCGLLACLTISCSPLADSIPASKSSFPKPEPSATNTSLGTEKRSGGSRETNEIDFAAIDKRYRPLLDDLRSELDKATEKQKWRISKATATQKTKDLLVSAGFSFAITLSPPDPKAAQAAFEAVASKHGFGRPVAQHDPASGAAHFHADRGDEHLWLKVKEGEIKLGLDILYRTE